MLQFQITEWHKLWHHTPPIITLDKKRLKDPKEEDEMVNNVW